MGQFSGETMKKAFACIAILAVVCGAVWHFCNPMEIVSLRRGIADFERSVVSNRAVNQLQTAAIFTSKGRFSIGTCEASRRADGTLTFHGPARTEGYFVVPAMRWAKDLAEAQNLASIHYVLHGGEPIEVTTSSGSTPFPNPE